MKNLLLRIKESNKPVEKMKLYKEFQALSPVMKMKYYKDFKASGDKSSDKDTILKAIKSNDYEQLLAVEPLIKKIGFDEEINEALSSALLEAWLWRHIFKDTTVY